MEQAQKPEWILWRGDWSLPQAQQGLKVLGVPVGHPSIIAAQMASKLKEQAVLFVRIPLNDDVQVGWLLLVFCAATRAKHWLRTVPPEHTEEYAMGHDRNVLQCLCILQVEEPSLRCGFLAFDFERFGCQWQFEDPTRCSLGQLGRLSRDDQAEASWER